MNTKPLLLSFSLIMLLTSCAGIGKQNSYVFKIDGNLENILELSKKIKFKPKFGDFNLDSNNVVTGNIIIIAKYNDLSENEVQDLKNHNFISVDHQLECNVKLTGELTKTDKSLQDAVSFKQSHNVKIIRSKGLFNQASAVVVTPITVVLDVAGILAAITLGPLFELLPSD